MAPRVWGRVVTNEAKGKGARPGPLFRYPESPGGSPQLLPNDHARLLIELLRPAGPELARRWLAALMLVPAEQRGAVVEAVERQIADEFATSSGG